jgi:anaerobic selenocysteine-containing dehydrogenase
VGLKARGDVLFLPHYEPGEPEQGSTDYPYYLNTYKLLSQQGTLGANQPWLLQQPAVEVDEGWESWVEIHPQTAARHGIQDGDRVWLESPRGRMRSKARLFPGAQPHVLNMPYGRGHRAIGRWARGRGQNPNEMLVAAEDPTRGLPIWGTARVRLRKA